MTFIKVGGVSAVDGGTTEYKLNVDYLDNYLSTKIKLWDSFNKNYTDKEMRTKKQNLFNLAYDIAPNNLASYKSIVDTYNSHDLIKTIFNDMDILKPIRKTLRHLFMTWKSYIESIIQIFVDNRNELDVAKNNFDKMLQIWKDLDDEHEIDTTSFILFFNFPPKNFELKNVPKIDFSIKSNSHISAFNKKTKDFYYKGYCDFDIINRWDLLLKFPITELIAANNSISKTKIPKVNKIYVEMHKTVADINKHINKLLILFKTEIKKSVYVDESKDDVNQYKDIISAYIKVYKDINPIYKNVKNEVVLISKLINDISTKINKYIVI